MKHIVVLGAGMVGSAIAADLCREYRVTAVDASRARVEALAAEHPLAGEVVDLSRVEAIQGAIATADLVIGAVPGFMGFATLRAVIEAGKNAVDISFFGEDPFELDALARACGVTAVVDCGVAPGLSNMVLGYHAPRDGGRVVPLPGRRPAGGADVAVAVQGPVLPDRRAGGVHPTRTAGGARPDRHPARAVGAGAGGDRGDRHAGGVQSPTGCARCWSPCPRSPTWWRRRCAIRATSISCARSRERLPGPGADQRWRQPGRPIDADRGAALPTMAVGARRAGIHRDGDHRAGARGRGVAEHVYRLLDRTDERTGTSSMARTTGYTCTAAARLVLEGRFARFGICPPEFVGADEDCFERVLADLAARGRAGRAGRALNLSCLEPIRITA